MADTVKVLQLGAFQLEAGKAGAGQSPGWGQTGSEEPLSTGDAFPWLTLGKNKTIDYVEDNSITSNAFKAVPRKIKEYVERSMSMLARFDGLDKFNYWMFGFENSIVKVGVFVINTPAVEPTSGATYRDTGLNDFTFLRKETSSGTNYWVFRADDSVVPTLQTGNLTKQAGTGDATLTMTAHSVLMYEHLYELDALGRHMVAYPTAEQITGYGAGDLKNRMATIGLKTAVTDYRYKNAMCKGFNFKSSAGNFAEFNQDFCAYTEDRGDYTSSGWTFPTELLGSDNAVTHHQLKVQLGLAESSLVSLGATSIEAGVEIPLQMIQDTLSGQYLAEPVLEGFYNLSLGIVLSRYSANTYQGYRDAWTSLVARISAAYGYYMQEFLYQNLKPAEAGPGDEDVAAENLKLIPGLASANNWSSWLYGNTIIQSGPMVHRVRNLNSTNMMFSI